MKSGSMSSLPVAERRIKNYFWVRERNPDELEWVRAQSFDGADLPRPLVLINGCWDILHAGHMRLIFAAREKAGDRGTLVCAMDSDRMVRSAKQREGAAPRPILSWIERAASLNYMPIDYLVEIDTADEFRTLVALLKPDLRVQGADRIDTVTRFPWLRKAFVRSGSIHTSEIIRRCRETVG
jgi:bifunctional ADP-heptose synthase (sugar kinase/adenylyltransferase)